MASADKVSTFGVAKGLRTCEKGEMIPVGDLVQEVAYERGAERWGAFCKVKMGGRTLQELGQRES